MPAAVQAPMPKHNTAIASGAAFGGSGQMGMGGGQPGEDIQIGSEAFHGGVAKTQELFPSFGKEGLQFTQGALSNVGISRMFGDGAGGVLGKLTKGLDLGDKWGFFGDSDGGEGGGGGDAGGVMGDSGSNSDGDASGGNDESSPFTSLPPVPKGVSGGEDVPMDQLGGLIATNTPGMEQEQGKGMATTASAM